MSERVIITNAHCSHEDYPYGDYMLIGIDEYIQEQIHFFLKTAKDLPHNVVSEIKFHCWDFLLIDYPADEDLEELIADFDDYKIIDITDEQSSRLDVVSIDLCEAVLVPSENIEYINFSCFHRHSSVNFQSSDIKIDDILNPNVEGIKELW